MHVLLWDAVDYIIRKKGHHVGDRFTACVFIYWNRLEGLLFLINTRAWLFIGCACGWWWRGKCVNISHFDNRARGGLCPRPWDVGWCCANFFEFHLTYRTEFKVPHLKLPYQCTVHCRTALRYILTIIKTSLAVRCIRVYVILNSSNTYTQYMVYKKRSKIETNPFLSIFVGVIAGRVRGGPLSHSIVLLRDISF